MGHFCREFKNPHIVLNLVAYLICATIPITFLKAYTNAAVYKNQNRQTVASANQCLCLIFLLHGKHRCMQKLFYNLFFDDAFKENQMSGSWSSASFLLKLKSCPNNFFLNLEKNMKISSKTLYIINRDTCISSHIMRKLWFLASKVHNKPVLHVGSHLTHSVIFSCVQLWELLERVPSISYRNWDQSVCLLILLPNHTAESDLFFFFAYIRWS